MDHADSPVSRLAIAIICHDQKSRVLEHVDRAAEIHAVLGKIAIGFGAVPFVFHVEMVRGTRTPVKGDIRETRRGVPTAPRKGNSGPPAVGVLFPTATIRLKP